MADVTKPILLDETGQEIVTALETIAENMGTSAGHTIQNDSGTDMQRRDKLQFKGVYVEDDQTNDVTKVDICRTMTKAQMEALSGEALKGFINTSDEPDSLPLTAEWVGYGNGSVKDGLDNKVSKTGDTMTGNLIVDTTNTSATTNDSRLYLGNNIPNGTTGSSRGVLTLYDKNQNSATLLGGDGSLTANRYLTLPDKSGTIALTSDIPTVSLGGTLGTDVLQFAKDMPNNSIAFFYNSNNPANQPSGCSWGSYLFIKYNNATSALYWDNYHFAHTYNIVSTATSINWHVV